jgi:photosystem II stability/assembly factor-like uncharacterized protein
MRTVTWSRNVLAVGLAGLLAACGTTAAAGTAGRSQHAHGGVVAQVPTIPANFGQPALSLASPSTVAALVDGDLVLSTNGGKSWHTRALPGEASGAIDFVSGSTGFAAAWTGHLLSRLTIFKTTTGGRHWMPVLTAPPTNEGFPAIDMVSLQDGWAILGTALYRTTDGGAHWARVNVGAGIPRSLDFLSALQGWIVVNGPNGQGGEVLATADGQHFHTILTTQSTIGGIVLNSATTGEVLEVGPGGSMVFGPMLRTTDDGTHWTTAATAQTLAHAHAFGFFGGLAFLGSAGWIGTNNGASGFAPPGLLATSNGGASWHLTASKHNWAIWGMSMTRPGTGWIAAGNPGSEFLAHTSDNGAHWTVAWPSPSPRTIAFASPKVGYGTGLPQNFNAVVRTVDGGRRWSVVQASPPHPFNAMAFSQSQGLAAYSTFVAAGAQSILYESPDGGEKWTKIKMISGYQVESLWYLGSHTWAMTVDHNLEPTLRVWISVDNGRLWRALPSRFALGDMVDPASGEGLWVVNNPSKQHRKEPIRVTLNNAHGRVERTVLKLPSQGRVSDLVNDISFPNTRDGWVSVTQFTRSDRMIEKPGSKLLVRAAPAIATLLYYTTDGGRRWTKWVLPENWGTAFVDLVNAKTGYMDLNGMVVATQDGGRVWRQVSP